MDSTTDDPQPGLFSSAAISIGARNLGLGGAYAVRADR